MKKSELRQLIREELLKEASIKVKGKIHGNISKIAGATVTGIEIGDNDVYITFDSTTTLSIEAHANVETVRGRQEAVVDMEVSV
jgi:preprotein translocase subunit YajC